MYYYRTGFNGKSSEYDELMKKASECLEKSAEFLSKLQSENEDAEDESEGCKQYTLTRSKNGLPIITKYFDGEQMCSEIVAENEVKSYCDRLNKRGCTIAYDPQPYEQKLIEAEATYEKIINDLRNKYETAYSELLKVKNELQEAKKHPLYKKKVV